MQYEIKTIYGCMELGTWQEVNQNISDKCQNFEFNLDYRSQLVTILLHSNTLLPNLFYLLLLRPKLYQIPIKSLHTSFLLKPPQRQNLKACIRITNFMLLLVDNVVQKIKIVIQMHAFHLYPRHHVISSKYGTVIFSTT